MEDKDISEPLEKEIGLFGATAIGVGAVIGAGIFVVTGIVAGLAGTAVIVSLILAGIISYFTAVSFSKLSEHITKEGGVYAFTYELVSPTAGFLAGWMWILSYIFIGATVALGFANYMSQFFPEIPTKAVAVVISLAFTFINYFGIKESTIVNSILVGAKIFILLFFIALGFGYIKLDNFAFSLPNYELGILKGTALIFFAYTGFARITTMAEEVKNPNRTIPRSITLTLIISITLYVLTSFVAVGLVGPLELASSSLPLAHAIAVTGNSTAVLLVSFGAIIATASVLLIAILGVSRVAFAMARNGDLPAFLRKIHMRYKTPQIAVWVAGLSIIVAIVLTPDLSQVVAISSFASLLYYSMANVSAINLSKKTGKFSPIIPYIGLFSCLGLLAFLSPSSWLVGFIGLAFGAAYYLLLKQNKKQLKTEA